MEQRGESNHVVVILNPRPSTLQPATSNQVAIDLPSMLTENPIEKGRYHPTHLQRPPRCLAISGCIGSIGSIGQALWQGVENMSSHKKKQYRMAGKPGIQQALYSGVRGICRWFPTSCPLFLIFVI